MSKKVRVEFSGFVDVDVEDDLDLEAHQMHAEHYVECFLQDWNLAEDVVVTIRELPSALN